MNDSISNDDRATIEAANRKLLEKRAAITQAPAASTMNAVKIAEAFGARALKEAPPCATVGCENYVEGDEVAGRIVYFGKYCPICLDQFQHQALESERNIREKNRQRLLERYLRQQWGEESIYHRTKLEDLPNQSAARQALSLCPMDSKGAILIGDSGQGKTRTAYLMSRKEIFEARATVVWNAITLRQAIAEAARSDSASARRRLVDNIISAETLVLDDLGDMGSTDSSLEALKEIVEGRTSKGKPIIATTQYDGKRLMERFSRNPEIATAIVRRLGEFCTPVYFNKATA
jgi:DNA replication protein DnaC